MNFHVLTLFPEMIEQGLKTSITGRALEKGTINLETVNIRDFSKDMKHHHVDDYPYGGGAGMVMQPGPVVDCVRWVLERCRKPAEGSELARSGEAVGGSELAQNCELAQCPKSPRVIYMTPQGQVFSQKIAEELSREEDLIFLCGHYEGIDERALELVVTDQLSIGDYVLTGGELPAMVMIDCISRLVPGVLNNAESAGDESFSDGLLEYPQYTRPVDFEGKLVPEILLSGNHQNVDRWRRDQSLKRTWERRPELLKEVLLDKKDKAFLQKIQKCACNEDE